LIKNRQKKPPSLLFRQEPEKKGAFIRGIGVDRDVHFRSAFELFNRKVCKKDNGKRHQTHTGFAKDAAIEESACAKTVGGTSYGDHDYVNRKNGGGKEESEIN
jgi:hypothetical protein